MKAKEESTELSIIIPLLNEEGNILTLYNELKDVISSLGLNHEIIFIDDGSSDKSINIIKKLAQKDTAVKGISLSRNFGHQIAITAGLKYSIGNIVITMDADLQHPPKTIKELYFKYIEGFDIVNTIRKDSQDIGFIKKTTSKGFYKLINNLSETYTQPAAADFRLMSRKTVNAFLELPEKDRFTRGLISWMGFKQTFVNYEAPKRFSGESKYSFIKMFHFAKDGITSFSAKPLRISFYIGLFISFIGFIYGVYAVVRFLNGHTQPGWTSILLSVLIIGGIQLISIGVIGEYLARVYKESKNRPLYFVKEFIQINHE